MAACGAGIVLSVARGTVSFWFPLWQQHEMRILWAGACVAIVVWIAASLPEMLYRLRRPEFHYLRRARR
jgi:hypothetical protein